MWVTVSDSQHDHEREALAWLRSRLPDREPYWVWTNFEFVTQGGQMYEVDALAITDNGFYLLELKAHRGEIAGDASTWQQTTPNGRFNQFDNPLQLANKKAKTLVSLLQSTKAFRADRSSVPFLQACVFLTDPELVVKLSPGGRHSIYGRDADRGQSIRPERASIGGIIDHLTTFEADANGRVPKRVNRQVVDKLVKAINQAGIRERSSRREVGDYRLAQLLHDAEANASTGVAHQDFLGVHRSLDLKRRLRVYPLELNATADQRQIAQRAARREFELLHNLDHPGILQPREYTEHERGPVLIFDYDEADVSLSAYLANPEHQNLPIDERLGLIRQVAEAVAYANGRGVFHRSLCPSAILVKPTADGPRVRVTNWHAGARIAAGDSTTPGTGTNHLNLAALASDDTDLYRAPEYAQEHARPSTLDTFGLGALSLFILTGQPPATSVRNLRETLASVGYLDPTAVADAVAPELAQLIIDATLVDPAERLGTAEDFLAMLNLAEEEWAQPDNDDEEVHPLEARRGETLAGRFEVVQRLGQGSTAVALLIRDRQRFGQLCVLKVAHDPSHNDRLLTEASALDGLQHAAIVALLDEPFDLAGLTAILITYAGPRVDPDKIELADARTLASRLTAGPVGAELAQRWGEDLLDALRYLEHMGRAHRDIKPENLGVSPRGDKDRLHLVLFDFSLSGASVDAIDAGTPGYLDPFLEGRQRWDPAADRYSAAVTLYEMTTGRRPRYGDGGADPALVKAPPTMDSALFDSAAAPGLTTFFTKALQPDAALRHGTADEMYWAWHEAFRSAAAPSTASVHPDDDTFDVPAGTTRLTPLAALPLSRRAVSALERADVLVVEDLMNLPLMRLRSLPGVGGRTRTEIREARETLLEEEALEAPTAGEASPGDGSHTAEPETVPAGQLFVPPVTIETAVQAMGPLGALCRLAVPAARRANQQTEGELARILAGLHPDRDPWATQSQLAEWLDVTPGRISQLVTALRKRWQKEAALNQLRHQLQAELAVLRVASVDQVAARILAAHPDTESVGPPTDADLRAARGLARVAALAEEDLAKPAWILRRRQGAALLASQDDTQVDAQAWADYALAVAGVASSLVANQHVVGRRELLDQLHLVPRLAGSAPLPEAHLADLAADLCDDASVNVRLELYRTGLDPVHALRATRQVFANGSLFTPDLLSRKVLSRFPDAADLPARPELDAVLAEAGVDLTWSDADGGYRSRPYEPNLTGTTVRSAARYSTNADAPVPAIEIDNAAEFEQRLQRSRNSGGVLVLVTDTVELGKADSELQRLVDHSASVDDWLVQQLEALSASGKPAWSTLAKADAEGPNGAAWGRLRQVVDRAADQLTERLLATSGTVLLSNLGLLARYDRLDLVARWRDALHDGGHPLQALWLLVPSSAASDVPLLDGRAVPVITRNEWSRIPTDWLRNAHRTATANEASS